eukprot:scaffold30100_cov90-Phaeocystis_antarctica.AAC.1
MRPRNGRRLPTPRPPSPAATTLTSYQPRIGRRAVQRRLEGGAHRCHGLHTRPAVQPHQRACRARADQLGSTGLAGRRCRCPVDALEQRVGRRALLLRVKGLGFELGDAQVVRARRGGLDGAQHEGEQMAHAHRHRLRRLRRVPRPAARLAPLVEVAGVEAARSSQLVGCRPRLNARNAHKELEEVFKVKVREREACARLVSDAHAAPNKGERVVARGERAVDQPEVSHKLVPFTKVEQPRAHHFGVEAAAALAVALLRIHGLGVAVAAAEVSGVVAAFWRETARQQVVLHEPLDRLGDVLGLLCENVLGDRHAHEQLQQLLPVERTLLVEPSFALCAARVDGHEHRVEVLLGAKLRGLLVQAEVGDEQCEGVLRDRVDIFLAEASVKVEDGVNPLLRPPQRLASLLHLVRHAVAIIVQRAVVVVPQDVLGQAAAVGL